MMNMGQKLVQNQSQRLMLTQKMQQALQILQYNAQELDIHIEQELEANPTLDRVVDESDFEKSPAPEATLETHDDSDYADVDFELDNYSSKYDQRLREGQDFSVNHDLGERRDYYQNSITKEESLAHKLMTQLELSFEDPIDLSIGEHIIGEIDDRGYFGGDLDGISRLNHPRNIRDHQFHR